MKYEVEFTTGENIIYANGCRVGTWEEADDGWVDMIYDADPGLKRHWPTRAACASTLIRDYPEGQERNVFTVSFFEGDTEVLYNGDVIGTWERKDGNIVVQYNDRVVGRFQTFPDAAKGVLGRTAER